VQAAPPDAPTLRKLVTLFHTTLRTLQQMQLASQVDMEVRPTSKAT